VCIYIYIYNKENRKRRKLHVDEEVYPKPDLHSATGCCNIVRISETSSDSRRDQFGETGNLSELCYT
jgi:hypothetical protein